MRARWLQLAAGLGVSGLLVGLIISRIDLAAFGARLEHLSGRWLVASFLVSALVLFARGYRYQALCKQSGWRDVTAVIAVQNALTRVTPLRLGELSLPLLLKRRTGEPAGAALVSLLLTRLFELWVLLATAVVAGLAWFGLDGAGRTTALVVGLGVMSGVLLTFSFWLRIGLSALRWTLERVGLGSKKAVRSALEALTTAASESTRLSRQAMVGLGVGTVLVVGLQFVLFWALMLACGLEPHPLQVLVGASAAQVAGALPVISVGSLGTHETGWTLGFVWVGLPLEAAVISGLFTQVVTLAFAAFFAAPGWWLLQRGASKVARH